MNKLEDFLQFMIGVACSVVVFISFVWLVYSYCTLKEFKYCYDIKFQDIKCTKYKNY